jgi:peptidoglycan/xylan/chitin deacetylase (PgdA/CDA1 family)
MNLEPAARERLGGEARAAMTGRFDHERITDRWEEQILQVAPTARSRRTRHAPAFVVSLDFELLWGMRDKQSVATYGDHILGEREAIPAMLKLFGQYGIRATWASVGMALFDRKEDLLGHLPSLRPTYERDALNPYGILGEIGDDERSDPYHYGLSLARQIMDCEGMEMGSHTFSHFYCLEKGQTAAQFRADLDASIAAVERLAERPVSLVFPRNQYNPEYLSTCAEAGFTCFRGNEAAWMYHEAVDADQPVSRRGARLLDNYLNLSGSNGFIPHEEGGLINCPSSRFLRPFSTKLAPFEGLRLNRIQNAMESAARTGRSFHLWWHPHNFGTDLKENLANLEALLRHHVVLRDRYGVVPMTMGEVAARERGDRAAIAPTAVAQAGGR